MSQGNLGVERIIKSNKAAKEHLVKKPVRSKHNWKRNDAKRKELYD